MNNLRIIRGRFKDAVASAGKIIRCSVLGLAEEQIDEVELFSGHGFSSVPDDDSECLAIQFGHRTIVIAGADRRIAPAMDAGDVAIHAAADQYVIIKASGDIEIKCKAGSQVNINNGNLTVDT